MKDQIKHRIFKASVAALALAMLTLPLVYSKADVKLPDLISEGMVLQQQTPVRIYGKADPNEAVTVEIQGQTGKAKANNEGEWAVVLRPLKAGGPYTLDVKGKNAISLKSVFVGEVWVCGGQSNMEWVLKNAFEGDKAIAASANPNIHLLMVPKKRSDTPLKDVTTKWEECGPTTVPNFSAVGYYFGRDLQKQLNVPIGLIASYWGGTPAESWTREQFLTADSQLKSIVDTYPAAKARLDKQLEQFPALAAKAKADGKPAPRKPNLWRYSELYNAMIAPLTPYTIRGVIWYQGESNAGKADEYRKLFPTMIENWRKDWGISDMPFLLVQLAPYMKINTEPEDTPWAHLREAQLYSTQIMKNVGMAVITDVGDAGNIHPTHKEPVGQRLALLARNIAYKEKIVANGPLYKSMEVQGNKVLLHFSSVGGGLMAKEIDSNGMPVPGGKLVGFSIAGEDGKFVWADAVIQGKDTVVVSSSAVTEPKAVRYGWANYPIVNLWNKEGLPASPFRTDAPK